jgi:flagellar biosynthesis chaperone FliJ
MEGKLLEESVKELNDNLVSNFKANVKAKIQSIAALQKQISQLQSMIDANKKDLKEMKLEVIDAAVLS